MVAATLKSFYLTTRTARLGIGSGKISFKIHSKKGGKMTTLNYKKLILVIVLPPFDLGQLLREDNGLLNKTYVYTYDNAGNIIYA